MRTAQVRTALVPLTLGAFLLAGCAAADDPSGTGTTPSAPDTTPTAEETAGAGDESAEPQESETSDATAGATGAECLEGDWTADLDATGEVKVRAPGLEELNPTAEVSGDQTVSFDGSTMVTEYEDQVTVLTLSVEGVDVEVTTTLDGTVSAAYTASDDELTVSDVNIEELSVETTATTGGADTELPVDQDVETFGVDLTGVHEYTCDGETLEITPQDTGVGTFTLLLVRD